MRLIVLAQFHLSPYRQAVMTHRYISGSTHWQQVMVPKTLALSFRSLFYGGIASLVYGFIMVLIGHAGTPLLIYAPDFQRTARYSGTIAKPPPTITLSYLPANPASASMVKLTAKVHAVSAGPTPTGHVRFFDGSAVLNTSRLNNGSVTVKGKLPHMATHSIRAIYYGDLNYSSSSSDGESE